MQQLASSCQQLPYFTTIYMKVNGFCTGFCTTVAKVLSQPQFRPDVLWYVARYGGGTHATPYSAFSDKCVCTSAGSIAAQAIRNCALRRFSPQCKNVNINAWRVCRGSGCPRSRETPLVTFCRTLIVRMSKENLPPKSDWRLGKQDVPGTKISVFDERL
jgi:hypothetical protein